MPGKAKRKVLRDPKGGLTAAGRKFFKEKEGARLKPGVKGPADTPEKMRRKGSFLRRHYGHKPFPLVDAKGRPTRYALQAHAWGEKVPETAEDVRRLARLGTELLKQYRISKNDGEPPARHHGGGKVSSVTFHDPPV